MRYESKKETVKRILEAYFQDVPRRAIFKPTPGAVYVLHDHGEDSCSDRPGIMECEFLGESKDEAGESRRKWLGYLCHQNPAGGWLKGETFEFSTYLFNKRWCWGSGAVPVTTLVLGEWPKRAGKAAPEVPAPVPAPLASSPAPSPGYAHAATELSEKAATPTGPAHVPDRASRPECQLTGTDGNVFSLMSKVSSCLKRAGLKEAAGEMQKRVFGSGSYHEALAIMCEYVDAD